MKKILILLFLITGIAVYFMVQNKDLFLNKTEQVLTKNQFFFKSVKGKEFVVHGVNKRFKIKGIKNKIVFLKVFGWNCNFCQKEIPELIKLKEEFSNAFDVIAIESQKHTNRENLEKIDKHGINYHIISGENQEDFFEYLKKEYNWMGIIPLTIIVGEDGQVLAFEEGFKSYSLAGLLKMALIERKKNK